MPELPEVETIKNGIERFIGQSKILSVTVRNPHLRKTVSPNFTSLIAPSVIKKYDRRAKYILIHLDNGNTIICHMGMSGKIKTFHSLPSILDKHDHLIFETSSGFIIYNDVRRFGMFEVVPTEKLTDCEAFSKLGIEPFDPNLTADFLYSRFQKIKNDIKPTLLDQKLIVGIGNIYASEILYAAGIHPTRPANSLTKKECNLLVEKIRLILKLAIDNGGSTLHDYQRPDGSLGYFQNLHCVYNKTGFRCPDCICRNNPEGGICKITQKGRSTFFCPVKQK